MSTLDPQEFGRLATLQEMVLQREQAIANARQHIAIRALIESEGWREVRQFWESRIEASRLEMLNADTGESAKALDTMRVWQLREKQWEELASFINGILDFSGDVEEILLKEQLNVHE